MQQRTSRTTLNQPNKSAANQANRAAGGQTRPAVSQVNRATSQGGAGSQNNGTNSVNTVLCRKCKSPQIVANKKGYSFVNLFKTLGWMVLLPTLLLIIVALIGWVLLMNKSPYDLTEIILAIIMIICQISISLSIPVSILVGFVGRNEIVNGCMNCGFKWSPAKKK